MIFSSRSFLQKMNEWILFYYYETSGRLVFVCFLEETEYSKNIFRNYLTFSTDLRHWFTLFLPAQNGISIKNWYFWLKNDGEKWSRKKNIFEIPPCSNPFSENIFYFIERRIFPQNWKFSNKNNLHCTWMDFNFEHVNEV